MSSGPVHNGGAFFLLWCGDRSEAPHLGVAAVGLAMERASAVGAERVCPAPELMPSPGRVSVVPDQPVTRTPSDAPPHSKRPSRWQGAGSHERHDNG